MGMATGEVGGEVKAAEALVPNAGAALGVCRMLHVYSDRWVGPRPGVVVGEPTVRNLQPGGAQCVHVNVSVTPDGSRDRQWIREAEARPHGQTLVAVPVYDPPASGAVTAAMFDRHARMLDDDNESPVLHALAVLPPMLPVTRLKAFLESENALPVESPMKQG